MPTQPSISITVDEAIAWVKTKAPEYLRDAQDETLRSRLFLKLLSKYGRILYKQGGAPTCTWTLQVDEPPVEPTGAYVETVFTQHDLYEQMTIDWRGYVASSAMTEKERAISSNGSGLSIVDYYSEAIPTMEKSMRNNYHRDAFIDGMASTNANRFCGLETCLGDDGNTVPADRIAKPSDTYAGLSTAPNGLSGGTWTDTLTTQPNATISTDWPDGTGTVRYDATSPLLINTTSIGWDASSPAWADNLEYAMRQGMNWQGKRGGEENRPKVLMFASDLFTPIQNYFSARFREYIPHREADDLGFADGTLNFDGVMVRTEFDVPAGRGYGFSTEAVELSFCYPEMWDTEGPEKDIRTSAIFFKLLSWGNFRLRPKGIMKFKSYA